VLNQDLACLAPKSYMVIQHRYAVEKLIEAVTSLNIRAEAQLKKSGHGIHIDFDFPESKFELTEVGESCKKYLEHYCECCMTYRKD